MLLFSVGVGAFDIYDGNIFIYVDLLFKAYNFDCIMFIYHVNESGNTQVIRCDFEMLPPAFNEHTEHTLFIVLSASVWISLQLHSNSDKGDGSVRYILDGEGAGSIFIIDEVTGDIHATKSLDREKKSHYVLHAQALDRYTEEALEPKSEFIIKVQDINDNAPKFPEGPFVATVPEMSEVGESHFEAKSIWFTTEVCMPSARTWVHSV